jgi:quercetin dioxygenase-like cupin family protein
LREVPAPGAHRTGSSIDKPAARRYSFFAFRAAKGTKMILSKNADVKGVVVKSIEGKPMYGGDLIVKPLLKGDEMTFLEIHYTPGVGAPLHVHSHESLAYVVKGKVKMTVGKEEYILGPGDVCRHPKGVPHGVEGIEESIVVEIKSPAPEIGSFLGM